jgi:hypothetical protein
MSETGDRHTNKKIEGAAEKADRPVIPVGRGQTRPEELLEQIRPASAVSAA